VTALIARPITWARSTYQKPGRRPPRPRKPESAALSQPVTAASIRMIAPKPQPIAIT
jgi:hypothetical protein